VKQEGEAMQATSATTIQPGSRLGPYEIVAPIGAGGMGEVYRARDTRLGRDVAIKVLPPEFADDPERLRRFEQEARAVAALSHPNVLALFDVGSAVVSLRGAKGPEAISARAPGLPRPQSGLAVTEGEGEQVHFLVTELLEGESLRDRLKAGGLTVRKAVETAVQIAQGLAAAHEKGIVHRDLKPANVFITKDGHVKILDFGLAKLVAPRSLVEPVQANTVIEATEVGTTLGTVGYMAPEQIRGLSADHRSDIFSFGCVLYELLSGSSPFRRDTPAETMTAILHDEPPPLPSGVPHGLDRALRRCLEKSPDDRFQSARDLAHDLAFELRAILADTGGAKTRRGLSGIGGRKRVVWLAGGSFAIALIAVGVFYPLRRMIHKPAIPLEPKRIVVAVFDNQTGDRSLDPLGRMASDWITQGLSRIPELDVVPSTSVLFAQPSGDSSVPTARDPIRALAEATGAGTVVSGTYYLQGQTLQFQTRVTDAVRGKLLHALEPVTGPVAAPMQAIDALRQRVTGAMAVSVEAIHKLPEQRPPPYDAYREFIAGFELFGTKNAEALRHLQLAEAIDPNFITPRMYAVYIYHTMGNDAEAESTLHYLEDRRQQLTPLARCWLDCMRGYLDHRYLDSLQALREAERLTPQDPMVNLWLGFMAFFANRPHEVVDAYARLDRDYWKHHVLGEWRVGKLAEAYHALGNYQRELEVVQRGLESFPESFGLRGDEVGVLAALGRLENANKVVDEILLLQSRDTTSGDVMLEAAQELRAHGHLDASQAMANRAIAWYRAQPSAKAATKDARAGLALALTLAARAEEARAVYEDLAAEFPDNVGYRGSLGVLAANRGDRAAAQRVSEELRLMERPRLLGANTYQRARIAAILGEKGHAVELLGQAFAEGMPFGLRIHQDSAFEGMRDYPPFQDLLKPKG
jgi:serine/threonine protein kinase/tetratricopeptide (TPR) repeat protein